MVAIFAAARSSFLVGGVGIVCADRHRRHARPRRRHRLPAALEPRRGRAHRGRHDRDSRGCRYLSRPRRCRRACGAWPSPRWRSSGANVRAVLKLCGFTSRGVIGRPDAPVDHRPLVADGAVVRALRHLARGGALRPLSLASPGAARARLARSGRAGSGRSPDQPTARGLGRDRQARERPAGRSANRQPVPVELDRVSYQYPGSNAWAVAEVSLSVEPGRSRSRRAERIREVHARAPARRPTVADARHDTAGGRSRARSAGRDFHDLPEAREPGARRACQGRRRVGASSRCRDRT